ncbi:MAG: FUSC family protein [Deltaproteobacteria bacterium]|nr:FUSC family protein [Deltaproteobacteria bacterium]MCK5708898.1 FUSC family protein [Deltaproteobacteria bacterium]
MFKSHIFRAVVENFIVAVVAYLLGYYFTAMFHLGTAEVGGLWAVISGVFVMADKESLTFNSARMRVRASFLGCLVSGVYLYFFPFTVVGFAICIAIGVFLCHISRIPDHIKTISITISVVIIISVVNHSIGPVANAGLRFAESVIGSLVAVAVALAGIYIYRLKKSE